MELDRVDTGQWLLTSGVTTVNLQHCGKMPEAREELNRSLRQRRMESKWLDFVRFLITTWLLCCKLIYFYAYHLFYCYVCI